tara:strand:+ start:580 stop:2133 length:1554 start_codon:yes stop_codon:yes gene_type:complete
MGMAKGGLRENNDRAKRMEERMQNLADNNATMARERANSRYDSTAKDAAAVATKEANLKALNHIDAEGNYTEQYYKNEAELKWKDPEVRKAFGGAGGYLGFEKRYISRHQIPRFVNQYKPAAQRDADLAKLHASISAKQQVESSQKTLTGLDRFMMKGADSAINTIGDGVREATDGAVDIQSGMQPAAPQAVPELAEASPLRAQEAMGTQAPVEPMLDFETPVAPADEIKTTYISHDADGTEWIHKVWKGDKPSTKEATGLTKLEKAGVVEMAMSDLKTAVDPKLTDSLRVGQEAQRLIGNILQDTTVETAAVLPKLYSSIIERIQDEVVGTVGSKEEKNKKTLQALGAAFASELHAVNESLPEDQRMSPNVRQKLNAKVAGLKQNKRALAYALVKLNRASGRFNGQELSEQLDLLNSGDLSGAFSVLKRAQEQVSAAMDRNMQDAAASVMTTHLAVQRKEGEAQFTKQEILGWVDGKPSYDPTNKAYFISFREGPYEFAYMRNNGGIELIPRETEE